MLIVLEGNDGSGKATQAKLLIKSLRAQGRAVETIDFPRYYDNFFGGLLAECLRGEHGSFVDLSPRIASTLYAGDRYESKATIVEWLQAGRIVVADRYTTANMMHQGGKIADPAERKNFMAWLEQLEYEVYGLPRPDLVLYLDVPVEVSLDNLAGKAEAYAQSGADQTETNRTYLEQSRATAEQLLASQPSWHRLDCAPHGTMKSRADIQAEIMKLVAKHL